MKGLKIAVIISYIALFITLIIESCLPGNSSARQSDSVGNFFGSLLNRLVGDKIVKAKEIEIFDEKDAFFVNETWQIKASVMPNNATYQTLTYISSDSSIASVDNHGNVLCKKNGSVTISISQKENGLIEELSFVIKDIEPTSLSIVYSLEDIQVGKTCQLDINLIPNNSTIKEIEWSSSDETIISVDENGLLTAIKKGQVDITAQIGTIKDTITVKSYDAQIIEPEEIRFTNETESIQKGNKFNFGAYVYPINSSYQGLIYKVNNANAKVDSNGNIEALEVGDFVLTIKTKYDETIEKQIDLSVYKIGLVDFTISPLKIEVGSIQTIMAIYEPVNANIESLVFESTSPLINLNDKGRITGLNSGNASIKVTINGIEKNINVEVTEDTIVPVTEIRINNNIDKLYVGNPLDISNLDIEVIPRNSTYSKYEVSVDDVDIIDIQGHLLIPLASGDITLTVRYSSEIFDSININVSYIDSTEIVIPAIEEINLSIGEIYQLEYQLKTSLDNIYPSNQDVEFSSSNPDVAIVDSTGLITALNKGSTSVKIENGLCEKSITVYIKIIAISSVIINNEEQTLIVGQEDNLDITINPYNVTNPNVYYLSSNNDILTIDEKGFMKAKSNGEAIISVLDTNNIVLATKSFLIENILPDLVLNSNGEKMIVGESSKALVSWDNEPTYSKLSYLSSSPKVARIGSDGSITALKKGTTTISIICNDGNDEVIVQYDLEVSPQSIGQKIDNYKMIIRKGIGHFGAFFVLAVLASFTYLFVIKKKWLAFIIALSSGVLLAFITEMIQKNIPGRTSTLSDVFVDSVGYLTFLIPFFGVYGIMYYVKTKKRLN